MRSQYIRKSRPVNVSSKTYINDQLIADRLNSKLQRETNHSVYVCIMNLTGVAERKCLGIEGLSYIYI